MTNHVVIAGQEPKPLTYLHGSFVRDTDTFTPVVYTTGTNNGGTFFTGGTSGPVTIEIINVGTGTCNVNLMGSMDGFDPNGPVPAGANIGYAPMVAANTRSISAIAVAANSHNLFQVQDYVAAIRAAVSGIVGSVSLYIRVIACPV